MARGIWTKWKIGAALLLLIVATGCILYYQHTTAGDKQAAEQADKLLQEWEADKAKKSTTADKEVTNTPAESTQNTAEKPTSSAASAQPEGAEVRVSKFGFGPYPELPADFPYQDLFDPPYYTEDPDHPYKDNPNYELMHRLRVELWKRGERGVEGFGTLKSTGLFYPTIRGTIYVEWKPRWKVAGKGFGKTARYIDGHPDDIVRIKKEGKIPSDLKVLDISEGINAYEFLNLSQ